MQLVYRKQKKIVITMRVLNDNNSIAFRQKPIKNNVSVVSE